MANWRPINEALGMSKSERRANASWFRKLPRGAAGRCSSRTIETSGTTINFQFDHAPEFFGCRISVMIWIFSGQS